MDLDVVFIYLTIRHLQNGGKGSGGPEARQHNVVYRSGDLIILI